jgi:predicted RNA-binding protein with PUA-like domain
MPPLASQRATRQNPRMAYWLVKTEPDVYSIDDLAQDGETDWHGVRNYQARNYLKEMKVRDMVLVYHSNAEPPGIVGIAKVSEEATPDETQFHPNGEYFDSKSSRENPRWFCPKLQFVRKMKRGVSLNQLREEARLEGLVLLQKGTRLSVIPVSKEHYEVILELGSKSG